MRGVFPGRTRLTKQVDADRLKPCRRQLPCAQRNPITPPRPFAGPGGFLYLEEIDARVQGLR